MLMVVFAAIGKKNNGEGVSRDIAMRWDYVLRVTRKVDDNLRFGRARCTATSGLR